jgi:hypothetical protein
MVFSSAKFGFSITLTTDYSSAAGGGEMIIPGTWTGSTVSAAGDPGTDGWTTITGVGIEFGLLPVRAGTTAAAWATAEAGRPVFSDCHVETPSSTVTVNGQATVLVKVACPEHYVLDALWIHGKDGVLAQWVSANGNEFLGYLATIKWH